MRGSGDAPLPDWLEAAGGLTSGSLTRGSSDSLLMLPTGQRNPARLNDRIRNEQETKAVSCPSSTTTVFDRLCDQHGGAIRQAGMGLCDDTRPVLDQSSGIAGSSAAGSPSRRRLPGCRIRYQTTPDSLCDDTGFPSPAGRYFLYTVQEIPPGWRAPRLNFAGFPSDGNPLARRVGSSRLGVMDNHVVKHWAS